MNTYEELAMNTMFGTYAWNASPVDGTDIQRAFAAVARHFKFPLDNAAVALSISEARQKNRTRHQQTPGQNTLEHIETMFPLFWRQKELLKLLNEERREHTEGSRIKPERDGNLKLETLSWCGNKCNQTPLQEYQQNWCYKQKDLIESLRKRQKTRIDYKRSQGQAPC
ncbi:unnamed protein product [Cylindrotheca closterium]|uniref:Uncharacterized protein n=1 Tax=Cylindrotheca closterium TaxID=2856 RepID=A0AAD2FPE4_9STRA|nr:unnamed protein product [Cylindrotheca closterium]